MVTPPLVAVRESIAKSVERADLKAGITTEAFGPLFECQGADALRLGTEKDSNLIEHEWLQTVLWPLKQLVA